MGRAALEAAGFKPMSHSTAGPVGKPKVYADD
jgi:hypothetical protein